MERYSESLISSLINLPTDIEWHILLRRDYAPPAWASNSSVHIHNSPYSDRLRRDQLWVPSITRRIAPSVTHFTAFAPPIQPLGTTPVITTVHDAVFWDYPQTLSTGAKLYYRPLLSLALNGRRVHAIITGSNSAAQEIAKHIPSDLPIHVTPYGKDESFRSAGGPISPHYSLNIPFFLSVGTLEPRKNFPTLISAYRRLIATHEQAPPLVLVGRRGWGAQELIPADLEDHIRLLVNVSDEDLKSLYRNCTAFILPSIYEGFGLPLLEAMASGSPCIASDIPVLREVGGDACLYAPPDSPEAFTSCLNDVATKPEISTRLRSLGLSRSALFSWNDCAEKTLNIYRDIANAG